MDEALTTLLDTLAALETEAGERVFWSDERQSKGEYIGHVEDEAFGPQAVYETLPYNLGPVPAVGIDRVYPRTESESEGGGFEEIEMAFEILLLTREEEGRASNYNLYRRAKHALKEAGFQEIDDPEQRARAARDREALGMRFVMAQAVIHD